MVPADASTALLGRLLDWIEVVGAVDPRIWEEPAAAAPAPRGPCGPCGPLVPTLPLVLPSLTPAPAPPRRGQRGRPRRYGEVVFLQGLVVLVLRRLPSVHALLAVLEEPEMRPVRQRLVDGRGRFPSRRTWERRLGTLPARLPVQIAALGRVLVGWLQPWLDDGRALALDSTPLQARGRVWHQRERRAGQVPDPHIDTEAQWAKSGWHGWVYGYTLHVLLTVCPRAGLWLPLAAELTPGNAADSAVAPRLLAALGPRGLAGRFVLADSAYTDAPRVRQSCAAHGGTLVASQRGRHAPDARDAGTPVRQVFHALRSHASENWTGQFKHIFDLGGPLPTRGLLPTQRFVLGAVLTYQLVVLDRFLTGRSLRVGLQAALQAA